MKWARRNVILQWATARRTLARGEEDTPRAHTRRRRLTLPASLHASRAC